MSVASSLTVYRAPGNNTGVGQVVVQADENGLAVSSPGSLQANSNIIPEFVEIPVTLVATTVTASVWMATNGRWNVASITCYFQTGSTSGTLNLSADSGTQAPGAGTAILSANISLAAAAQQTVLNGTLASPNPVLGPGDRLAIEIGGTMTSLANGIAVIRMRRLP